MTTADRKVTPAQVATWIVGLIVIGLFAWAIVEVKDLRLQHINTNDARYITLGEGFGIFETFYLWLPPLALSGVVVYFIGGFAWMFAWDKDQDQRVKAVKDENGVLRGEIELLTEQIESLNESLDDVNQMLNEKLDEATAKHLEQHQIMLNQKTDKRLSELEAKLQKYYHDHYEYLENEAKKANVRASESLAKQRNAQSRAKRLKNKLEGLESL